MKISREWATPLVIGVFALMAVTGGLMFFHLDSELQKTIHEWAGWLLVTAAAAHIAVNWLGFKRYFQRWGRSAGIVTACVVALGASFAPIGSGDGGGGASPPSIAIRAVSEAPLPTLAALFHRTPEATRAALAGAGLTLTDDSATLAQATGGDREKLGAALRALSAQAQAAER